MNHVHADLIKQWADGAEVQVEDFDVDDEDLSISWIDVDHPMWYKNKKYRIKPKKEKRWLGVEPISGYTTKTYQRKEDLEYFLAGRWDLEDWKIAEIEVEV